MSDRQQQTSQTEVGKGGRGGTKNAGRDSKKTLRIAIIALAIVALAIAALFAVKVIKSSKDTQSARLPEPGSGLIEVDSDGSNSGDNAQDQQREPVRQIQETTLDSGQTAVANEILLTVESDISEDELLALLAGKDVEVSYLETISTLGGDNLTVMLVGYTGDESPDDVCKRVQRLRPIVQAEPNYVMEALESEYDLAGEGAFSDEAAPGSEAGETDAAGLDPDLDPAAVSTNDPRLSSQWGLTAVGAQEAWEYSKAEGSVIVAVIDSGVDIDHPDLAGNLLLDHAVNTYTDTTGAEAVEDENGHGTHVAGTIAAVTNNGIGVAGVSYNAKILPIKATYVNDDGEIKFRTSDVVQAIDVVVDYKTGKNGTAYYPDIKVMNLSLGIASFNYQTNNVIFNNAIQRAVEAGILPVAAGGNNGSYHASFYPASYEGVIGVSALKEGARNPDFDSRYSNYGPFIDLSAPGTTILSTTWAGGYSNKTGTSMAASFVSGAAALLFAQDETLTPGEVIKLLEATAEDLGEVGYDQYYGYGLLRVDAAAQELSTWARFVRLAGLDRYATAQAIALEAFPDGSDTAIVCTGKDFPDALAASSLAGVLDCPILITDPRSLSVSTREAIGLLGASDFVIVGGTGVVSEQVEGELEAFGGTVERLAGTNRYETAEAVCSWEQVDARGGWADTVIIATAGNYPDALSISGFAFSDRAPILLSSSEGLTPESRELIQVEGFDRAIIVGGTGVVPATMESELEDLGVSGEITRLSGVNRYETSLAIADYLLREGFAADCPAIATGENYPDALTGSALVGRNDSLMLLASSGNGTVYSVLGRESDAISKLYLLGGTGVVTYKMTEAARAVLEPDILAG